MVKKQSEDDDPKDEVFFQNGMRKAARDALGSYAEPNILLVSALPKTVSGKTSRAMLRAMLSTGVLMREEDVGRSITNSTAYWDCARVVDVWRQSRMISDIPAIFSEADWDEMRVEGHSIGGSPLVPGTGWLAALSGKFRYRRIEKVQFLRATRDKTIAYVGRKVENRLEIVDPDENPSSPFVRCTFPYPPFPARLSTSLDLSPWKDDDIVDDIDGTAHYRRCRSVGLNYSGPFVSVERSAWRLDFSFRAAARVQSNFAALLDAALQVVCCLDAVGPGIAYIPFAIDSVDLRPDSKSFETVYIVGTITARSRRTITADIAFFPNTENGLLLDSFEGVEPIATMVGLSFSALAGSRRRLRGQEDVEEDEETYNASSLTKGSTSGSVLDQILVLAGQLTGGSVDPSKSLFENGLYSLRGVELIGRLNAAHDISLDSHEVAALETFEELATFVQKAIGAGKNDDKNGDERRGRFGHVNVAALNRIARARYHGTTTGHRSTSTTPLIREAYRALVYMLRRGFLTYLAIQYRDGLVHFMMNPPKVVDLDIEVIVPGLTVAFHQTDYNRHFTVREIVRDSERGFYNLVHASGLAHLEHYYRVMFFASRLEARFDLELLEGEKYEMRVTVAHITGPLVDVAVAFHKMTDSQPRAFVVTWRLMLVIDAQSKRMYDFERGTDLPRDHQTRAKEVYVDAEKADDNGDVETSKSNRTWAFVLFALFGVYAFCAPLLFRAAYDAFDVASLGISPIEVLIVLSALTLWARISFRLDTCDGPIDTLLPHG